MCHLLTLMQSNFNSYYLALKRQNIYKMRQKGWKTVTRNFLIFAKHISGPSQNKVLSLTIGFYLGVFPVIGTTTIMCLLAGFLFRLNHFILQSLNILLAPLQLLLVYPFLKAGRVLFFQDKSVLPGNVLEIDWFGTESWNSLYYLFETFLGGILIWLIFAVSTGFFFYKLLGTVFLEISNS